MAAIGSGTWAVVAEAMPKTEIDVSSLLGLVEYIVQMSPTAILAVICWMLWKRYTTREDELASLQKENIAALQRVADALERFEDRRR